MPDPTVAIDVEVLLHEPPGVTSLNVIDDPMQTFDGPVIAEGNELTVTLAAIEQPVVVKVYDMGALPNATPVTTPEPETTVAIPVLPLLQVPPPEGSFNVVVAPIQVASVPPIAAGKAFIVTVVPRTQPKLLV